MTAVVADASVLVGELLRRRGRQLFRHPDLTVFVAEEQWEEAQHELARRLVVLMSRAQVDEQRRQELVSDVADLVYEGVFEVVPKAQYSHLQVIALRRVPRDERDWPTVAAAIALGTSILTADGDFLGCGVATWTVETLMAELENS